MTENKYRAKRKDNREWIVGYFWKIADHICIIPYNAEISDSDILTPDILADIAKSAVEIDPKTLCQYAGKSDRNNQREFYENDVIKARATINDAPGYCTGIIQYGTYEDQQEEHYGFYINWIEKEHQGLKKSFKYWVNRIDTRFVTNIFDNPTIISEILLKKQNKKLDKLNHLIQDILSEEPTEEQFQIAKKPDTLREIYTTIHHLKELLA